MSRSRPVHQTGTGAGNLGRQPGWSLGPCLVRWCLSTALPCSGGTGQGRLPTHWSVPALHRLTALCDPWLNHEAQRGRVAHLRPHKSWVAGLGVCRQASLMLGLGLFQTITLLSGSQRPRTACRSHQPSPSLCLALSRCSTDIWGQPGGVKHSACSKCSTNGK